MSAFTRPQRRLGCLGRLLIFVLFLGACYLLLLAPLPERVGDQVKGSATPEPSEGIVVEGEINPAQQAALEELLAQSGQAEVLAQDGQIRYLTANVKVPDSAAASLPEKATYFLQQNRNVFQVHNPGRDLKIKGRSVDEIGTTFIRYEQDYKGIPVYGSEAIVEVNQTGEINSVIAGYSPNLEIDVQPAIRSTQAENIALEALGDPNGEFLVPTRLVIYDPRLFEETTPNTPRLAWEVMAGSTLELSIRSYLVDAQTGEILLSLDEIIGARERNIWDTEGLLVNPKQNFFWVKLLVDHSKHVMNENGPVEGANPDDDAKRAWQHADTTYQYYYDNFNRDSFDGEGGSIEIYVNFGYPDNALWQPLYKKAFFSDGWTGLDIIAHELTHGVWWSRGIRGFNLGKAAALNESFGDVFAAFIDHNDPWRITSGDSAPGTPGQGLVRDLADPAKKHYSQYDKNVDAYQNSTIHSHAVYLLSEGTKHGPIDGIEVIGIGRTKAQYIYYDVMVNRLTYRAGFEEARKAAIASCNKLIGRHNITSSDCDQVMNAYAAIGIGEPAKKPSPQLPEIPDLSDTFYNLLQNLRWSVNDVLGDWSPIKLWQPFQDSIDEMRNSHWVRLLECMKNSDQACIDQFLTEIFYSMLEAYLKTVNEVCLGVSLVPAVFLLIRKRKLSSP